MLAEIFYILLAAMAFFVVISALIFFHELGHYSVARAFRMRVDRFSIGFGKAVYKHKAKSGTTWMISRIPLGGYVKFAGDAGAASNPDHERLEQIKEKEGDVADIFHFRPVWQRALVVLAGPVANFILAAILFAIAVMWVGTSHPEALVGDVEEGSAAAVAGIQPGDRIVAMDGKPIRDWLEMSQHIQMRSETEILTLVERNGQEVEISVTPRLIEDRDFVGGKITRGQFGIRLAEDAEFERRSYNPVSALAFGTRQVGVTLSATGHYIGRIFSGKEDGKQLGSVGRIATVVGKSTLDVAKAERPVSDKVKAFLLRMLQLGAGISVALGFANLLPIPMLDGGHLVYYAYEAVAGEPLSEKKQEFGFRLGVAVLLALFVVLTINDIGYFRSL